MEVDNTHPSSFRADTHPSSFRADSDNEISTINYLILHEKISVLFYNTEDLLTQIENTYKEFVDTLKECRQIRSVAFDNICEDMDLTEGEKFTENFLMHPVINRILNDVEFRAIIVNYNGIFNSYFSLYEDIKKEIENYNDSELINISNSVYNNICKCDYRLCNMDYKYSPTYMRILGSE